MAVKPEEAKAALVEKAIGQVRERLSGHQADAVERFVRSYYAEAAPEDLGELDLYGAALAHWHVLQRRRPGEAKVHVYTPTLEEHGWASAHSVPLPFFAGAPPAVSTTARHAAARQRIRRRISLTPPPWCVGLPRHCPARPRL